MNGPTPTVVRPERKYGGNPDNGAERRAYADIREYLAELDRRNLLIRVDRRTNKNTEIMPLVRWQYRGLDEEKRRAWLFENVTDSRGRDFDGSVAVSIIGARPGPRAAR